jgi:hypothetical protein
MDENSKSENRYPKRERKSSVKFNLKEYDIEDPFEIKKEEKTENEKKRKKTFQESENKKQNIENIPTIIDKKSNIEPIGKFKEKPIYINETLYHSKQKPLISQIPKISPKKSRYSFQFLAPVRVPSSFDTKSFDTKSFKNSIDQAFQSFDTKSFKNSIDQAFPSSDTTISHVINDVQKLKPKINPEFHPDPKPEWIIEADKPENECKICNEFVNIFSLTCSSGTTHLNFLCWNCANNYAHKEIGTKCPWCGNATIQNLSIAK